MSNPENGYYECSQDRCPKCGEEENISDVPGDDTPGEENIFVTCFECGYQWHEPMPDGVNKLMLCESCSSVQPFKLDRDSLPYRPERFDYSCNTCGWLQTSPEGGYCEVLCSWMQEKGLASFPKDPQLLADYIWQSCQGSFGKHYAAVFADELCKKIAREST
jgi:hypothetical protein